MKILLEAKEKSGRSFKEIGAALGTDQCAAHGILKGRRASSFERLFRISRFLELDDDAFFSAWKKERGLDKPEQTQPNKYMSVIEAARYTGYSRGYIHKLLFDGKLGKCQDAPRGYVLVARKDLDTFMNAPRPRRKMPAALPPPELEDVSGIKELLRSAKKTSGKTFGAIGAALNGKSGYYVHSILRESCRKNDIIVYLKISRFLDISDHVFFTIWRREKGYLSAL